MLGNIYWPGIEFLLYTLELPIENVLKSPSFWEPGSIWWSWGATVKVLKLEFYRQYRPILLSLGPSLLKVSIMLILIYILNLLLTLIYEQLRNNRS